MAMPLTAIDPLVPLLKVTVWAGLLLPTVWLPKLSEAGVTVTLPPLQIGRASCRARVCGAAGAVVLMGVDVKHRCLWHRRALLRVVGNGPMPQLFCWL